MKVRTKSIMAGPDGVRQPGIHNLPRPLALELIKTGQAERIADEPEPEVIEEATDKQAEVRETATAPAQRRRPRKKVS